MPSSVELAAATAAAHADLAANFCVYCLTKPTPPLGPHGSGERTRAVYPERAAHAPALTPSTSADAPPPITYEDVVQQLNTANDDAAGEWSFAPYPACSRAQLLQVHAYWVAVPRRQQAGTVADTADRAAADGLRPPTRRGEHAGGALTCASPGRAGLGGDPRHPFTLPLECESVAPAFVGVVGVVWVRLSPAGGSGALGRAGAGSVEGYLQVVLTHPRYRRRGLATWLLHACLATTRAPAGAFAVDRLDDRDRAPYRIERWHLHTLAVPSSPRTGAKKRSRDDGDGDVAVRQPAPGAGRAGAAAAATIAMYRRLGFEERRYLARYYAGQDDAVELIKTCV